MVLGVMCPAMRRQPLGLCHVAMQSLRISWDLGCKELFAVVGQSGQSKSPPWPYRGGRNLGYIGKEMAEHPQHPPSIRIHTPAQAGGSQQVLGGFCGADQGVEEEERP